MLPYGFGRTGKSARADVQESRIKKPFLPICYCCRWEGASAAAPFFYVQNAFFPFPDLFFSDQFLNITTTV